jgi:hypothetical protein
MCYINLQNNFNFIINFFLHNYIFFFLIMIFVFVFVIFINILIDFGYNFFIKYCNKII